MLRSLRLATSPRRSALFTASAAAVSPVAHRENPSTPSIVIAI
jgi:hypothetical protein